MKKRCIRSMFVIVLIIAISSCPLNALDQHADYVSRGDFFVAVAKGLELDQEVLSDPVFPDYDNSNGYINALVNRKWVIGGTDGLIGLEREITREEMGWFLERIVWPKEEIKVKVPEYIAVGVPIKVYVEVPADTPEQSPKVSDPVATGTDLDPTTLDPVATGTDLGPISPDPGITDPDPTPTGPCALHKYVLDSKGYYNCEVCKVKLYIMPKLITGPAVTMTSIELVPTEGDNVVSSSSIVVYADKMQIRDVNHLSYEYEVRCNGQFFDARDPDDVKKLSFDHLFANFSDNGTVLPNLQGYFHYYEESIDDELHLIVDAFVITGVGELVSLYD